MDGRGDGPAVQSRERARERLEEDTEAALPVTDAEPAQEQVRDDEALPQRRAAPETGGEARGRGDPGAEEDPVVRVKEQ